MSKSTIKIQGKSGCPISIKQDERGYSLVKVSKNKEYSPRLKKQAEKQHNFYLNASKKSPFYTPQIIAIHESNELTSIEMEFINAESYSTFLSKQTKRSLDVFIENLFIYIKNNTEQSTFLGPSYYSGLITQKIEELELIFKKLNYEDHKPLSEIIYYLKNSIPKSMIPIGPCHGDFTLSNMLFSNNEKIYLIDFLDSFIESPFIDYVKLRQDTKYYWSSYLENQEEGTNVRLIQALNYIDKEICKQMKRDFKEITEWEEYLTVMNFARIIPYAESINDINFLTKQINTIIK